MTKTAFRLDRRKTVETLRKKWIFHCKKTNKTQKDFDSPRRVQGKTFGDDPSRFVAETFEKKIWAFVDRQITAVRRNSLWKTEFRQEKRNEQNWNWKREVKENFSEPEKWEKIHREIFCWSSSDRYEMTSLTEWIHFFSLLNVHFVSSRSKKHLLFERALLHFTSFDKQTFGHSSKNFSLDFISFTINNKDKGEKDEATIRFNEHRKRSNV